MSKKNSKLMKTIIQISFCVILLIGCTAKQIVSNQTTPVSEEIKISTMTSSSTRLMKTETPKPTTTRTKRPTYTPSRTSLPTMPSEESLRIVEDFLSTNGDCEFPCYWGMLPGKTKFEEVKNQFLPIANDSGYGMRHQEGRSAFGFYFLSPNDWLNKELMVTIIYDDSTEIVEMIMAGQEYAIKPFFEKYGNPDQIYITNAYSSFDSDPGVYNISFYYSDMGIIATITGISDYEKRADGNYTILCQELLQEKGRGTGFILWSPELFSSYSDVKNYLGYSTVKDKLLENTTNMTNDEFYNMLIGNGTSKCLEIPMSYWGE